MSRMIDMDGVVDEAFRQIIMDVAREVIETRSWFEGAREAEQHLRAEVQRLLRDDPEINALLRKRVKRYLGDES